jgi:nickel-dependent lactate racemase
LDKDRNSNIPDYTLKPSGSYLDSLSDFADLLGSCSSPDQALQVIEKTYKLGYHKAAKMASVCKRMKVLAYTKLTDCQVASLFLEPVSDLQAALDGAIAEAKAKGIEKPSIILLPDGCVTVPSL